MILINVALACRPERVGEFRQVLLETMAASRVEDGCETYVFTADLETPSHFHLVELWRDEEALESHLKGPAFQRFLAALPGVGEVLSSRRLKGNLVPYEMPKVKP